MTTQPTIADAKAIAVKCRSRGVLILALNGSAFSVTTYGMTRADCDAMREVNRQIADLIEDGTIEIPDRLRT